MQFDWMVQCYAGDGVHRDTLMVESLERDDVLRGADTAVDVGLEGLWAPDHFACSAPTPRSTRSGRC